MNVYDIEIDGIDLSSKTFSVLAENIDEATKIADSMVKPHREGGWSDAEVIGVTLKCYLTIPKDYIEETIADIKQREEKE
jgi:hypothetical protein